MDARLCIVSLCALAVALSPVTATGGGSQAPPPAHSAVLKAVNAAQHRATAAVLGGMVRRVLGQSYVDQLMFDIRPPQWPSVDTTTVVTNAPAHSGARMKITAASPVDAAHGLNAYLRQHAGFMYAWDGQQSGSVPQTLPLLQGGDMTLVPNLPVRYFSNVCTFSYSFVWWDWPQWERFIDWLALNSFNAPLAHVGQEAVWRRVWKKLGLSQSEIAVHFTGPAFLAWERMGNLMRFGGPLSSDWHFRQEALQKKIIQRMTQYGMVPVLPAFSGHIPTAVRVHYPQAKIDKVACWGYFSAKYTCLDFLDPTDGLFQTVGDTYMSEMNATYGMYGLYSADPFNEMSPPSYQTDYVRAVGSGIYHGMSHTDADAVWVMQAWFLLGGWGHWMNSTGGQTPPAETLFRSVPTGNLLLLDLYSEGWPVYEPAGFYYGQPYVFNVLHNFGGTDAMFGGLNNVNDQVTKFLNYPTNTTHNMRIGFGLTMEGIYQNYPQYQFAIDRYWSKESVDAEQWISDYATQRYGQVDDRLQFAWKALVRKIYNRPFGPQLTGSFSDAETAQFRQTRQLMQLEEDANGYNPFSPMFRRPELNNPYKVWYDKKDLCSAWGYIVQEAPRIANRPDLFMYDLTDITRQVLVQVGTEIFISGLLQGYADKNATAVSQNGNALKALFQDLDTVLKADRRFLLGRWVDDAREKGNSSDYPLSVLLAKQYEFNLRNQITAWGPRGEIRDYARKQWAGVLLPYHGARWDMFSQMLLDATQKGTQFDQSLYNTQVRYEVELPFTELLDNEPNTPVGDPVGIAQAMHGKYYNTCML